VRVHPIRFCASEAPIEAPTPTLPAAPTASEAVTMVASMIEVLSASIRTSPALESTLACA
jgi:hypothetical protein